MVPHEKEFAVQHQGFGVHAKKQYVMFFRQIKNMTRPKARPAGPERRVMFFFSQRQLGWGVSCFFFAWDGPDRGVSCFFFAGPAQAAKYLPKL